MSIPGAAVYIIDDDTSFRRSLERLIRACGWEAVSFGSASEFLSLPQLKRPACLLLDVRLPDANGLALQQKLMVQSNSLPVIFMTGHGNIPMSVQAMKNGAVDFLPKPFDNHDLRRAVTQALEQDARHRREENRAGKVQQAAATLTPREREVMTWVIAGKLNKQIAQELGTTVKTIKVHRSRVMEKMQASSVPELVRLADTAGIKPAA